MFGKSLIALEISQADSFIFIAILIRIFMLSGEKKSF